MPLEYFAKTMYFQQRERLLSFTLIELLVVIAIISALAALLMPALREAKDRANTVKCMSNLHQIGIAMEMFGGDHDCYPHVNARGLPISAWRSDISYYLEKELFPSSALSSVLECPAGNKYNDITNVFCTYSINSGVSLFESPYPLKIRSSDIILIADGAQMFFYSHAVTCFETRPSFRDDFIPEDADKPVDVGKNSDLRTGPLRLEDCMIRFRHNNNTLANFLFVDGHVASLKTNQVLQRNIIPKEPGE